MFASMGCFFSPQFGGIAGKWHGKKRFIPGHHVRMAARLFSVAAPCLENQSFSRSLIEDSRISSRPSVTYRLIPVPGCRYMRTLRATPFT